ncbi:hypothetical protein M6D81_26045 [Paenibacillus sp. J5C_2022]|uniref:enolase C-terminal domain-like protein n=1 Tax=Paenibacillus sp. J5C2022 TaxID=2977129 RepID=UPI0021CEAC51|nr:enolase C-terminal domain-like protein [Paenibacillus sp. J5C2022]MCU6712167.1 hypothetical protein [Paenibacillus sp. J5C2022]
MELVQGKHAIQREPLLSPFGFKGAYLTELWQSVAGLWDEQGRFGLGVGVQSVLWSDADLFVKLGEAEGNALMANMTKHAMELSEGLACDSPFQLLNALYQPVLSYGKEQVGHAAMRSTFALNALVAVDQAAWSLFVQDHAISFDDWLGEQYGTILDERQAQLANVPLIPYGMTEEGIDGMLREGYGLLKVKIGADPAGDGDRERMLEWDMARLKSVHELASRYETPYTLCGKIAYYLDANGRYENREQLMRFIDYADRIGALDRIVLFEEPFPEQMETDVSDLPVRFAADESVHDEADARARIDMGYGAFALKPVAKTMSMSLNIAKLALEADVACFCADLTANPMLTDWNKNLACRLPLLPELKVGILESNGHQNYRNWETMKGYHPRAGAPWLDNTRGVFRLDEAFYAESGGALESSPHYKSLLMEGR